MLSAPVYNQKGEKVDTAKLPVEIFAVKINNTLLHQAVVAQSTNKRKSIANTKTKGEVRGGGRKPWRQKGTGRARHGSTRSPIWRGGGVTFGPRSDEQVFKKKINKKMKRQALFMALTSKVRDEELRLLENLEMEEPKTKRAKDILSNLFKKKEEKSKSILIVTQKDDKHIIRASKNIPQVKTLGVDSLNVLDLLYFKYLIMSQS